VYRFGTASAPLAFFRDLFLLSAVSIMASEAEKYEVLERIGALPHPTCRYRTLAADLACESQGKALLASSAKYDERLMAW